VRGDPAEMKRSSTGAGARALAGARRVHRWAYAMATGQWEEGRIALRTEEQLDRGFRLCRAQGAACRAAALEQQGKPELARLEYEAALAELRARQAPPGNATLRSLESGLRTA